MALQLRKKRPGDSLSFLYYTKNVKYSEKIEAYDIVLGNRIDTVEILRSMSSHKRTSIIQYLVSLIGACDDATLIKAYAGNILISVFPSLYTELANSFKTFGIRTVEIGDREMDGPTYDLPACGGLHDALFIMAQTVLVLFKNINVQSYEPYMRSRIQAMKAAVGIPDPVVIPITFSHSKALIIRGTLGAAVAFKRKLLRYLLTLRVFDDELGKLAAYVCKMLVWHEMTAINTISDVLVLTRSPVLLDGRVRPEVLRFRHALQILKGYPHPEFYMILEKNSDTRALERNNFPTLLNVALTIKSEVSTNAQNFIKPGGNVSSFIMELVAKHHRFVTGAGTGVLIKKAIAAMTDYDDEDSDDDMGDAARHREAAGSAA